MNGHETSGVTLALALGRHGTALVMRTSRRTPAADPEYARNTLPKPVSLARDPDFLVIEEGGDDRAALVVGVSREYNMKP